MSADALHSIYVLLLGFSVAGALATGYQAFTARPASFNIFGDGTGVAAVAHVPFLVFAAPFIIMRNTLRARRFDGRRFESVMVATIAAGIWSLMTGTVAVMAVAALRS